MCCGQNTEYLNVKPGGKIKEVLGLKREMFVFSRQALLRFDAFPFDFRCLMAL
jgi:hypothetical protein